MASKTVLNDEEFLLSHLADYLDETLSSANRQKVEELMKKTGGSEIATDYGIRRGRLQIEAQRLYLDEKKMRRIHELVEDDAARANNEAAEIDEVGKSEMKGNAFRFIALLLIFGFLFGGAYFVFRPAPKAAFKALDSLLYEAIVMSEDAEERLAFPTDKVEELNQYFQRYPELGFAPKPLKTLPAEWKAGGGTVIDYETAKIMAVQFQSANTNEKLYIFLYPGKLSQLPKSDVGNANGIVYQTYASDRLNVVAWSVNSDVTGMVIGSRGARELADFAYTVIGP